MTTNKYSHIKTFKDFENEKLKLHYQIRIAEKKMEIKKLELREYLNPLRFFTNVFSELAKPTFDLAKSIVMFFVNKYKKKHAKTDSEDQ